VLLQKGGPLVLRRLCAAMGPEVVFREFASILEGERDTGFAGTMVQVGSGGRGGGGQGVQGWWGGRRRKHSGLHSCAAVHLPVGCSCCRAGGRTGIMLRCVRTEEHSGFHMPGSMLLCGRRGQGVMLGNEALPQVNAEQSAPTCLSLSVNHHAI
jgi:hypothetical protein